MMSFKQWGVASTLVIFNMPMGHAKEIGVCKPMSDYIQPQQARYALTHNQIPGQLAITSHDLQIQEKQYKLSATSKASGMAAILFPGTLNQRSEGLISPTQGFVPLMYSEKKGKKPIQEAVVDPKANLVTFKKNDTNTTLQDKLQDRLSIVYQLSAQLRCSSKAREGDSLSFHLLGTGSLKPETFTWKSTQSLELELDGAAPQNLQAALFELAPKEADDDVIRVWFAPSMNWQAVRIQVQDKKGDSLTQTLVSTHL